MFGDRCSYSVSQQEIEESKYWEDKLKLEKEQKESSKGMKLGEALYNFFEEYKKADLIITTPKLKSLVSGVEQEFHYGFGDFLLELSREELTGDWEVYLD